MTDRYEVAVEAHFSAAHALRGYKGKCEHLHGHNWRVRVGVEGGKLNDTGLLIDFGELKRVVGEILSELDHRHLNEDVPEFRDRNPSTEEIGCFLAERTAKRLPDGVRVAWVEVEETPGSTARFYPAR